MLVSVGVFYQWVFFIVDFMLKFNKNILLDRKYLENEYLTWTNPHHFLIVKYVTRLCYQLEKKVWEKFRENQFQSLMFRFYVEIYQKHFIGSKISRERIFNMDKPASFSDSSICHASILSIRKKCMRKISRKLVSKFNVLIYSFTSELKIARPSLESWGELDDTGTIRKHRKFRIRRYVNEPCS